MLALLIDNPLLLLFVVAAAGYSLGQIKVGGFGLGVAAVLFVGLAVGALDPALKLPEVLYLFGLVLFVYTIGLSSGPGFFATFNRKGIRNNLFVIAMLGVGLGLTFVAQSVLQLRPTFVVGMFTGSLTNTPALAGVLETLKEQLPAEVAEQVLAEPVVGYSITYPMGVVGMILAIYLLQRLWGINYRTEGKTLREVDGGGERLINRTILITRPDVTQQPLAEIIRARQWDVVFGRMRRDDRLSLASGETQFAPGDLVSVIAPESQIEGIASALGEVSHEELALDRQAFDLRRMFVSNPRLVGHRLAELNLPQQFGAIVTRVRRGDVDLLAHGDTVLELGDRVRVLAPRERMDAMTRFFGDSYRALSEIDIATFSVGLALGLLLGVLPIPLPGGFTFKLGLAGGPLIVALILGKWGRSGPFVWSLPYSANLTLRQMGLILFLAGVGTRSGYAFVSTLGQGMGLRLFLAGTLITCTVALLTLWIGYKVLKIPMGLLIGILAGLQTQPAILAFGLEQSENDLPNIGYASVYPIATIAKIILAQVLLEVLQ